MNPTRSNKLWLKMSLIAAAGISQSSSASTLESVITQLESCKSAAGSYFDSIFACPEITTLKLTDTSVASVREGLNESEGLNLQEAKVNDAIEVIGARFDLSELRPEIEEDALEALDTEITPTFTKIKQWLRAQAKAGASFLIDGDTYWAPSVNASAVVVIDHKNKKAVIIMHGDADG